MPVAVSMIGTDVTIVPTAGPSVSGPTSSDLAGELVAHEHVVAQVERRCDATSGTPSIASPSVLHGGAVLDEVEVGAADAAGLDVDERPDRRPGTGSATSSRDEQLALGGARRSASPHLREIEAGEEVEQRGVDLDRLLLLDPVAGAVDEHGATVVGERSRPSPSGGLIISTGSWRPPMNSDGTVDLGAVEVRRSAPSCGRGCGTS